MHKCKCVIVTTSYSLLAAWQFALKFCSSLCIISPLVFFKCRTRYRMLKATLATLAWLFCLNANISHLLHRSLEPKVVKYGVFKCVFVALCSKRIGGKVFDGIRRIPPHCLKLTLHQLRMEADKSTIRHRPVPPTRPRAPEDKRMKLNCSVGVINFNAFTKSTN